MAGHRGGLIGRFAGNQRGVSAVEFALCLPVMLLLYLGGIEISQAVSADRKVTLLARSVGDLVAQQSAVTTTDVGNIFSAASAILYPFPLSRNGSTVVTMQVSEIWTDVTSPTDPTPVSKFEWKCSSVSGSPVTASCAAATETVTVPAAELKTATVMAVVTYTWTPTIAYEMVGPISLSQTLYMRPRLSPHVAWSAS